MRSMVLLVPNPQKSASIFADEAAFHIRGPATSSPTREVNDTNVNSCTALRSSVPSPFNASSMGMMLNVSPRVE